MRAEDRFDLPYAEYVEVVGRRVAHARGRAGLSQLEMARQCGISRAMIASVELGRAAPSLKTLFRIASVTRTTVASLTNADVDVAPVVVKEFQAVNEVFTRLNLPTPKAVRGGQYGEEG